MGHRATDRVVKLREMDFVLVFSLDLLTIRKIQNNVSFIPSMCFEGIIAVA